MTKKTGTKKTGTKKTETKGSTSSTSASLTEIIAEALPTIIHLMQDPKLAEKFFGTKDGKNALIDFITKIALSKEAMEAFTKMLNSVLKSTTSEKSKKSEKQEAFNAAEQKIAAATDKTNKAKRQDSSVMVTVAPHTR